MPLIVVSPFLTFSAGELITDPGLAATLLADYPDRVVRIDTTISGNSETLAILAVQASAGLPCRIFGTVINAHLASGVQWSVDNGTTWTQATGFAFSPQGWSCYGPIYNGLGVQPPLFVRDAANPGAVAISPAFSVSAPAGVSTVAGLGGTVSAVALKTALAIGIADVAGLGNAAASNFGTAAGSVADGGALASAAASASGAASLAAAASTAASAAVAAANAAAVTASVALPLAGGTLTGNVALPAGGTLSSGGTLFLVPGSQLWLGNAAGNGALYSATIAGVTSNPGTLAAHKLWNNGGAVCLSTGTAALPAPAFAAGTVAAQSWGDVTGSATIFPRHGGVVPVPPAPLASLLLGDREKLRAVFNFAETWATETNNDAYPALQSFLLYCQMMALTMKDTGYDNNCFRMSVTAYLPRGTYLVSQPLVVPEYVNLHTDGLIVRTPFTGDQSNNGTTSVPGAFYAASSGAQAQFEPTVIVAPRGHASRLNVYVGNANINYRGSGVAIGKTWQAQAGGACIVGQAGSGYAVGDIVVLAQPAASTYWPWTAQVTGVNGTGGITGALVYQTGGYGLPPSLQAQQWTAANGFSVFDPADTGCFLQTKAYRSDFVTPSPGTGATLAPTWTPDFVGGQYNIGAVIQTDTLIGHLNVSGFVPGLYSQTYGGTWGVLITGLNGIVDEIEILGGNDGVYCHYANDWRITTINCVGAGCGLELYGCGSIECPNVVFDTCGAALLVNQSDRIIVRGLAFFEQNNIGQAYAFPAAIENAASQGFSGYSAIQVGQASTASFPNAHLDIAMTLVNMGGLPASTIALYPGTAVGGQTPRAMNYSMTLSYTFSSRFDIRVSNIGESGGAATLLPSSGFVCLGQGVDASNEVLGTIDGARFVTGPAATLTTGHGWPGCGISIWDAVAGGYQGAGGTYELSGSGAPTSLTGVGKAAKGSTYRDLAGPGFYIQTGAIGAPSWTQIS